MKQSMKTENSGNTAEVLAENEQLRHQLAEVQETLRAIHHGEVDALVVNTPQGPQIYTLTGAETTYRLLIEQMTEGAVILSDDNKIMYCNKGFADMIKAPLDKLIGSNMDSIINQEHLEAFRKLIEDCRSGTGSVIKEVTFKAGKNRIVPVLVSANSLISGGSKTTFIVTTDLSKHMQDDVKRYTADLESIVADRTKQLREKERMAAIGQTAGMVGHDIRNPLQSIVSELYLVRQELKAMPRSEETAVVKDSLDSIEEQTFYINKIVADLQDYTKPLLPKPHEINLDDVVHDSLTSVIIPNNIAVELRLAKDPKLNLDPLFIKRVLVNLISNAIQAMPTGGVLTITTVFEPDQALLTVHDTGTGIPDEVKPQIFQPLFTTKAKGQGLGLAVVKRLTEASGGQACFESEAGKGTSFIVKLPRNA